MAIRSVITSISCKDATTNSLRKCETRRNVWMYGKFIRRQFLMSSRQNVSINADKKPWLIACESFPPISDFTSFDRTSDWLVFYNITIKYNISYNVHPFQSAAGMILRILKVAFTVAAVNFFQISSRSIRRLLINYPSPDVSRLSVRLDSEILVFYVSRDAPKLFRSSC